MDMRGGVLRRTAEWVSPTGRQVRVSSTRLVSFTQRAVVAIEYVVEALGAAFPVVVQLVADALLHYGGSARQSLEHAQDSDRLPASIRRYLSLRGAGGAV